MADPVVGITNGVPTSGTGTITTLGQTLLDGANATMGITTGAAVTTSAAGTLQQYLRGVVSLLVSGITVAAHAVTNAGTFAVQVTSTVSTAVTNAGTFAVQVSNANANGGTTAANSAPVVPADQYATHKEVLASQTAAVLGATGAIGDYLAYVTVFPGTAGCGVVTILDAAATVGTFAGGGTTALPSLVPFVIPIGAFCTGAGWKITTGANVTVTAVGKFT